MAWTARFIVPPARRSLEIALEKGLATLAFPGISTGIYGFPIELAAPIAIRTVREFTRDSDVLREVTFCCFSAQDLDRYRRLLAT